MPDEVGTGLCEAKTGFSISGLLVSAANVSKWSFSIDLNKERFLVLSATMALISQLLASSAGSYESKTFVSPLGERMFLCFVLSCFVLFIYNVRVRGSRESCAWSAHDLRVESSQCCICDVCFSPSEEISLWSGYCVQSAHGLHISCVRLARWFSRIRKSSLASING